ncbi:SURF1 family-domain-containing protein [Syncephalis fuscata]|nr:SURF1 family-domain-containing protein [Syncephalis fuscata]
MLRHFYPNTVGRMGVRPNLFASSCSWSTLRTNSGILLKADYSTSLRSNKSSSTRPATWKMLCMAAIPLATFGLGTWQVQRLRWKVGLIQDLEERSMLPAVPLPKIIREERYPQLEYRRFYVTGTFLHDKEILMGPRTRGEGSVGYFVITPFRRDNGQIILIKRGWIALDKKEQSTRLESLTDGPVTIEGMLRQDEMRNAFSPTNRPEDDQWFNVNVAEMAAHAGTSAILLEELSDESSSIYGELTAKGIPIGRPPVVEVRNMHAQYAFTWYSLSALTTVMLAMMFRRPTRVGNRLGR